MGILPTPDQALITSRWISHQGSGVPTRTIAIHVENSARPDAGDADVRALAGVRVSVGVTQEGDEWTLFAVVSASNASSVWGGVQFTLADDQALSIDTGSARLVTSARAEPGLNIGPDAFTSKGALLGYWDLDGVVRPGKHFAGTVYFDVSMKSPSD